MYYYMNILILDYLNSTPLRQDAAPETREAYIVKNRDMQRSRFRHIRQIGWWRFAHNMVGYSNLKYHDGGSKWLASNRGCKVFLSFFLQVL